MKVRTKMGVMAGLSLLVMFAIAGVSLLDLRQSLMQDRQVNTRHVVETVHALVAHFHGLAQAGTMTDDEAKTAAVRAVKALRYDKDEYFWINDMGPTMVMHPFKPQLDGKDLSQVKDPNGKKLFVEFVDTVKAKQAGFVYYLWPKPGMTEPVEKVSYVSGFAPWGWIIGSGIYLDDIGTAFWLRVRWILVLMGGLTAVVTATVWSTSRGITGRLEQTIGALNALVAGDLTRSINIDSGDELGAMAGALTSATAKLNAVVGELEIVIQASQDGRLGVRGDASRFDGAYAELVAGTNSVLENLAAPIQYAAHATDAIASSAKELTTVSRTLGSNADETLEKMLIVEAAAEEVSRTTQSFATGTDEMASTIREIAKNAADSARVAGQAVSVAEATSATITRLAGSAAAIGKVIKIITSIAQQTNLLALNATIEAARAGEAGKGFAVVANEVKELARETAKATEDIGLTVQSIQSDTNEAATAIGSIGQIIGQINDMVSAIASAVEEQSATTNAMGRNIGEAARGAGDIAMNIRAVSQVAKSTSNGANKTLGAAADLSRMGAELKQLISKFSFEG